MELVEDVKFIAATPKDLIEYTWSPLSLEPSPPFTLNKKGEPLTGGPCSISGLVGGKYIFVISDGEYGQPSKQVVYYDIRNQPPYERTSGPSLVGAKARPTLITMGSKLFAFSFLLFHKYKKCPLDSKPRGEFLDTTKTNPKLWKWTPLPRFPKLPYPQDSVAYTIVSFAVWKSTLFLSLGESADAFSPGVFSFYYDTKIGVWSESVPLPFRGEGKFVGPKCYGISFAPKDSLHFVSFDLTCYQLLNNPHSDNSGLHFSWVELCRYSLPSTACPPIRSFYPLQEDVFAIIRVRQARKRRPYLLDIDVVELVHSKSSSRSGRLLSRNIFPNEDGFNAIAVVAPFIEG